ncbi:MAG: hypothetical protein FJ102_02775 [Deltaproteobacteria bacterium]|nr:hypothetical protein [Deltaproteobacteria bacterium]
MAIRRVPAPFTLHATKVATGDSDLDEFDVKLLRKAFELIDDNIQFVKNYYDRHAPDVSQTCHVTRLTGGDFWYPKPMIYETTYNASWIATNLYGSRYLLFDRGWLQGVKNSYQATSSSSKRACLVLEVARLIVHETSHSCWLPENFADLVDYYFGRAVAKDQGLVGTEFCCCDEALEGGYDEWDYDGRLVSEDPNYQGLGQDEAVSPTEAACGS